MAVRPWDVKVSGRGASNVKPRPSTMRGPVALDRMAVTITFTATERPTVQAEAAAIGLSLAQYVRTRCGWLVRQPSLPNTSGRYREEDDAQERLQRLCLEPKTFFPQDESQTEPTQYLRTRVFHGSDRKGRGAVAPRSTQEAGRDRRETGSPNLPRDLFPSSQLRRNCGRS